MNEQTIGRFNISLLLITKTSEAQLLAQVNERYGSTLVDEVKLAKTLIDRTEGEVKNTLVHYVA